MSLEDIQAALNKKYGGFVTADQITNTKRALIPVSPSVDIGLNGGLLTGTVSIFAGSYKTGKTTTALQAMANAQKVFDFPCFYVDVEGRGGDRIFSQVEALDRSKVLWIGTTRERIMDGEDFLECIEEILKTTPNAFIILDSISRLYARDQRDKEVSGTKRAPVSKLLSDFVSRISGIVPAMNSTLVCIAQTYDNVSGYGAKKLVSGGNAIQFQNDTSFIVKSCKDYMVGSGDNEKRVGNVLEWNVENVPFGSVPTKPVTSYIKFGYGCDNVREVLVMAVDLGLIQKKGAWYNFGEEKFQGEDNLYKYLSENPQVYDQLWGTIKTGCLDHDLLESVCKTKEEFDAANEVVFEEKKTKKKKTDEE